MFYLEIFLKFVKRHKASSIIYIVMTFAMLFSITNHNSLLLKFFKKSRHSEQKIYFNALVRSGVSISNLKYKISSLPGVLSISNVSNKLVKKKLSLIYKQMNQALPKEIKSRKYNVIRVNLKDGIKVKELTLIKEYFRRVVGSRNLTFSTLKRTGSKNENILVSFIQKYGSIYFASMISFLWFISFIFFTQKYTNFTYIMNRFQRRRAVSIMPMLSFTLITAISWVMISITLMNQFNSSLLVSLALLFVSNFWVLKSQKWSN